MLPNFQTQTYRRDVYSGVAKFGENVFQVPISAGAVWRISRGSVLECFGATSFSKLRGVLSAFDVTGGPEGELLL